MPVEYILVDLENVQPGQLPATPHDDLNVWLFAGSAPAKITVQLAAAVHALGSRARYIQMSGSGRNALDFHIACYLGQLTVQFPDAHFTIISKDSGYDPIISHLKKQGIRVKRSPEGCSAPKSAAAVPGSTRPNSPQTTSTVECSERSEFEAAFNAETVAALSPTEILRRLLETTKSRPRSPKALANLIKSHLQYAIDDTALAHLLRLLAQSGHASVIDDRIEWRAANVPV
jgi:hypothetical protein